MIQVQPGDYVNISASHPIYRLVIGRFQKSSARMFLWNRPDGQGTFLITRSSGAIKRRIHTIPVEVPLAQYRSIKE